MKKLFTFTSLIIFLLTLVTISCKKDKDQDYSFLGVWYVNSMTEKVYINGTLDETYTETMDPGEMVIKLFEDGTGEEWEDGILNDEFDWTVDGNIISVSDGELMELTWSVSGNTLTLTMEEEQEDEGDTYRYVMTIVATDEDYPFVGTWNVNTQMIASYKNGVLLARDTIDYETGGMVIKIFDNGKGEEWEDGSLYDSFSWTINGDVITVNIPGDEPMNMTYTVVGNTLTLVVTMTDTVGSDVYLLTMTLIATRAGG